LKAFHNKKSFARQIGGLTLVVTLASFAAFAAIFAGDVSSSAIAPEPTVRVRGIGLTYYRAPEHVYPPDNMLDPYDSFLKDRHGDLIITSNGKNIFSDFAQTVYQGYVLKTRKGNPVIVYQATPGRRLRHKSNCHGLTFLEGDFWLLGSQVERIFDDNHWVLVSESQAARGDVAVYRDYNGRIAHTARVTGRDAEGHVLVDSKNGFELKVESVRASAVVPY